MGRKLLFLKSPAGNGCAGFSELLFASLSGSWIEWILVLRMPATSRLTTGWINIMTANSIIIYTLLRWQQHRRLHRGHSKQQLVRHVLFVAGWLKWLVKMLQSGVGFQETFLTGRREALAFQKGRGPAFRISHCLKESLWWSYPKSFVTFENTDH